MEIDILALGAYTELVKEYGPKFVQDLVKAAKLPNRKITREDLEELKKNIKRPEEYENGNES